MHEKVCRYRDHPVLYPLDIWTFVSCGYCYSYTPPERFNTKLAIYYYLYNSNNTNYSIPCTQINEKIVFFDHTNDAYVNLISPSFTLESYMNKWKQCCEEAVDCCTNILNEENMSPTDEYPCPALWEGWTCYPRAKAGTVAHMKCPSHSYTPDEIVCTMNSEKQCFENGTWNTTTNYAVCASAPIYRLRHSFHVIVLGISVALSFPSVVIFVVHPKLRVLRIILQRNLIISIILKNILSILSKVIVILDSLKPAAETNNVMNNSGVACKVLAFTESFSKNLVFACMMMVGYYLHKSIARVFSRDPSIYFIYGTLTVSVIPTTIWAILMATNGTEYCWMVDSQSWYQWISDGFKLLVLVINTVLLIDIIRVILTKGSKENNQQNKSAMKVAIFLIPLFGIPLLFTGQRSLFNTDSCVAGNAYYLSTYFIEALQGVIVALLFCYLNKEVHKELKNSYRKFRLYLESRYGINYIQNENRRRTTAYTNVRTSVVETK